MFRVAICDDELAICLQLESLVKEFAKTCGEEVDTEVFTSGKEFIEELKGGAEFDLLFLDIEMEKLDGVKVGKLVRTQFKNFLLQIVYVSGKTEYALELFQVHPFDFLVKPIDKKKIYSTLAKLISLAEVRKNFFSYQQGGEHYSVKLGEIIYFKSMDREIKMITVKNPEGIVFYGKLGEIDEQLNRHGFLEVHRSYIVNTNHIVGYGRQQLTMVNNDVIPVSQSKRKDVKEFQIKQEMESFL